MTTDSLTTLRSHLQAMQAPSPTPRALLPTLTFAALWAVAAVVVWAVVR